MKKITKIFMSVMLACGLLFSACSDLLNTDTDRYVQTEDNGLNSANDTLYSVLGIMSQMRQLADRYVVLGELRADLMDLTVNSNQNLQEIANINYENKDNPYLSATEYYSIINNCNYYIQNVDTSIMVGGKDVMLIEYVAVKGIRAWTYLQLGLNYGKVPYITEPILKLEDVNKDYEVLDFYDLAKELIEDLDQVQEATGIHYEYFQYPEYANRNEINGYKLSYSMIPISYLLGDLYLWTGQYEKAATHYQKLMTTMIIPDPLRSAYSLLDYSSYWRRNPLKNPDNATTSCGFNMLFQRNSTLSYSDLISGIMDSTFPDAKVITLQGLTASLDLAVGDDVIFTYELAPSKPAMKKWDEQIYAYWDDQNKELEYFPGDLRGSMLKMYGSSACPFSSYRYALSAQGDTVPMINKYLYNNGAYLYRYPTLVLRYAEAVNQLGKPTLAMAALKYGLKESVITNPDYVDQEEVTPRPAYADFSGLNTLWDTNMIGIHVRGAGRVDLDTLFYIIPENLTDTKAKMDYVDKLILEELALETAFEGNRFHDLMRFAYREKGTTDILGISGKNILSEAVEAKNPEVASKLTESKNWFIPSEYLIIGNSESPEGGEQPENETE